MLLREVKLIYHKEIDKIYGVQEVTSFFYLLIDHFLKLEKFTLALTPDLVIDKDEESILFHALSELKQQVPVQHIIGETEFMDLKLKVSPNVLIPRPETEDLVRWILEDVQGQKYPDLKIVDIGTGSGCIAISLAKRLADAKVYALDISTEALGMARLNADKNGVPVVFQQVDILNDTTLKNIQSKVTIIVSNPPYVRELEKNEMSANVLEHEPEIALFVPDKDPLVFYKAIVIFAKEHLVNNGYLYLEINQYLGKEVVDLLISSGFEDVELRKDIFGNNRLVKGVFRG